MTVTEISCDILMADGGAAGVPCSVGRREKRSTSSVRSAGGIVAEVNPEDGFAMTEIDLNFRHESWIGSNFENRNWGDRRPSVHGVLTADR